jgi:catechol 2,3-dioxygenase-like lactoylglutathione lyase family enzyme
MQIIPVFHVSDMKKSLDFYTKVLGFKLKYQDESTEDPVITITNDFADIQLSSIDGTNNAVVNVRVGDVDSLFESFIKRGLDTSKKKQSPVHQGPLDQTWGMREFYVTDHDGHTLRFGRPLNKTLPLKN